MWAAVGTNEDAIKKLHDVTQLIQFKIQISLYKLCPHAAVQKSESSYVGLRLHIRIRKIGLCIF